MSLIEKALRQLEADKKKNYHSISPMASTTGMRGRDARDEHYEAVDEPDISLAVADAQESHQKNQFLCITGSTVIVCALLAAVLYKGLSTASRQTSAVPGIQTAPIAVLDVQKSAVKKPSEHSAKTGTAMVTQGINSVQVQLADSPVTSMAQEGAVSDKKPAASVDVSKKADSLKNKQDEQPPAVVKDASVKQDVPAIVAPRKQVSVVQNSTPAIQAVPDTSPPRTREQSNALNNTGLSYLELGDYTRAQMYFEQALSIDPANETALNNMGLIMYGRGNFDEAIKFYQRALKITPGNIELYVNLGTVYRKKGDYGLAEQNFTKALSLNAAHPETLYNYALLLKDRGEQKKARSLFEQFLMIAPARLRDTAEQVKRYLASGKQ